MNKGYDCWRKLIDEEGWLMRKSINEKVDWRENQLMRKSFCMLDERFDDVRVCAQTDNASC